MIERRRPILSAIANRKMFMGGGMATSMPQPTYMDLMPQQMGIPREAQGIMASSQPLVDAIAADANNPAGGDTLSMAQGGVAKFDSGGTARFNRLLAQGTRLPDGSISIPLNPPNIFNTLGQPPASLEKGQIDTLTPNVVFEQGAGSVARVPQNPIRMDFDTILNETNAERLERIFPEAAKNRFQATYEQLYPSDPDGSPRSYAGETARRVLSGVADFAGSQMEEIGQDIYAIYNVLFTGEGREQFGDRDKDTIINEIGTARAVAELIQRRPDLNDRILSLSKTIIDNARRDGTKLSGKKLTDTIAYGLSMESEINPNIGFATAQADADRPTVDPPPPPPPEPDIGLAGGPTALDAAQQAVPGEPLVVDERDPIDDSLAITNEKGEIEDDVPRPKKKPPAPENLFEGLIPRGEEQAATAASEAAAMDDTIMGGATPDAAAQFAQAFDKKMSEPEAEKTIADYKREFMDQMPEYQGMSEEEKGFALMEAGLRVAAGRDPNAITNVANGLKGLGAQFAKDEKEKRNWNRQVELSAIKYGFERFNKDEENTRVLETTTEKFIGTGEGSFTLPNGKTVNFKEDEVVFVPRSVILDRGVPSNLLDLGTRGLQITAAATKAKAAAVNQKAIRDELVVKDKDARAFKKEYLEASDKVVLGYEVKALIENAFDISDQAAGLKNLGKELIFKGLSATGWRPESLLGEGTPEQKEAALVDQYGGRTKYNQQMQEVANRLLKRLLGEGSKNVSNVDRELAQEISGLVKDIATGVSSNPTLLRQRLKRILDMSNKDIRTGEIEMQTLYNQMSQRILPGTPLSEIGKGGSFAEQVLQPLAQQSLRERRAATRTPQQQEIFGNIPGFTFKGGKYVVDSK